MELNMDFAQAVAVETGAMEWVDSPMPGVQRRMLERRGVEKVERATSLVRYAAGSQFDFHTHPGGEEILVLEGTFSDEMGDFPAGTYVRNPRGSRHRPHSEDGCVLFVKLCQIDAEDSAFVRINTRDETLWQADAATGVRRIALHSFREEQIALYCVEPGARFVGLDGGGGEELFIIDGSLGDAPQGTWLRSATGDGSPRQSRDGCTLYVKSGHLRPA